VIFRDTDPQIPTTRRVHGRSRNVRQNPHLHHDRVDEHGRIAASSGRLDQSFISATTLSVIRDTVSLLIEAP
jgi:hypothetical protein